MKLAVLFFLFLARSAFAYEPTSDAISSCLLGSSGSSAIDLKELATHEIYQMDGYKAGYNATYYFKASGKEIGYAKKRERHAIIYDGAIFPITTATVLPNTRMKPYDFNPYLASWNTVTDAGGRYLCVSFNFDGIGMSGSFQNERGAYLLSIQAKHARKLFFVTGDIKLLKGNP